MPGACPIQVNPTESNLIKPVVNNQLLQVLGNQRESKFGQGVWIYEVRSMICDFYHWSFRFDFWQNVGSGGVTKTLLSLPDYWVREPLKTLTNAGAGLFCTLPGGNRVYWNRN